MIELEQFTWKFADAADAAVSDVSLRIGAGEFIAIAGPSGSGKTTLALAMCGLLIGRHGGDAEGQVLVDGEDVWTTPLYRIAERVGLVQQNPETHFATLNVRDEIAFGLENRCQSPEDIERACTEAMNMLRIAHLRDRDLATLSGGEKQRVAIASIVSSRPAAIVLDEPTASLDPETSERLFATLADMCRESGLTVVIIEHKLGQLLPLGPRLVCMESGRIVLDAPPTDTAVNLPAWLLGPTTSETESPEPIATQPEDQRAKPVVEVEGVSVKLDGRSILSNVSLEVRPGEVIGILGPNGSGKSTLLHAMLGLIPIAEGTMHACEQTVSSAAVSRLARYAGLVFQNADHQIIAESVWAEALFASHNLQLLESERETRTDALLTRVGIGQRKDDHPHRLSWGQKRRLNLVSAVLHDPQLLLLDEPFAGQDWENVALLLEVIRDVVGGDAEAPGGACLIITHDPRVVERLCTRVVFMIDGRITVDAPVEEGFARLRKLGHDCYTTSPAPRWLPVQE